MKVVVDSPEDYKKWLSDKVALAKEFKASKETSAAEGATPSDSSKVANDSAAVKVAMK